MVEVDLLDLTEHDFALLREYRDFLRRDIYACEEIGEALPLYIAREYEFVCDILEGEDEM